MWEWMIDNKTWLFSGVAIALPLAIISWLLVKKSGVQKQKSGDDSVNIQAEKVSLTTGLTYSEVRNIALDVFEQNFYKLAGIAADTARRRAEEITDKFLEALERRSPKSLEASRDPDFQYSLFTAQLEYAKAGDERLGDVLVDLLVDRAKEQDRTLISIVLNESIKVAPQLTPDLMAALSLVFTLRYTIYLPIRDEPTLRNYLKDGLLPFISDLPHNYSSIQHLEYSGCSSMSIASVQIEKLFLDRYPGLFAEGFDEDVLAPVEEHRAQVTKLLVPCFHDSTKLQFDCINVKALEKNARRLNLDGDVINLLKSIEKEHRLSPQKVQEYLGSLDVSLAGLFRSWKELRLGNMSLTSVGIAIGHANVRRVTGRGSPLSIWIK